MESVAVITNLIENTCDEECRTTLTRTCWRDQVWMIPMVIILMAVLILLCVNLLWLEKGQNGIDLAMDIREWKNNENKTYPMCPYTDQFPLTNDVYVSICSLNQNSLIDIRRFKNGLPTIEGIQMSKMQWQYLKASAGHIDSSILKRPHLTRVQV